MEKKNHKKTNPFIIFGICCLFFIFLSVIFIIKWNKVYYFSSGDVTVTQKDIDEKKAREKEKRIGEQVFLSDNEISNGGTCGINHESCVGGFDNNDGFFNIPLGKENTINDIKEIDYSKERPVEILATDADGFYVENLDDVEVKKGKDKIIDEKIRNHKSLLINDKYEEYKLSPDFQNEKGLDYTLYNSIKGVSNVLKSRTTAGKDFDKATFGVIKEKGTDIFQIQIGGLEGSEEYNINDDGLKYLSIVDEGGDLKFFGGILKEEYLNENGLYEINKPKGNGMENIKIEKFDFYDDETKERPKLAKILYNQVISKSQSQSGNAINYYLNKVGNQKIGDYEFRCYTGIFEDVTYGYKLHLGKICVTYKGNEFYGISNEIGL